MGDMVRTTRSNGTFHVDTVLADCDELDLTGISGVQIYIPSTGQAQTLTPYVAPETGGTFLPHNKAAATAYTIVVAAGQSYELDSSLFAAGALKLLGGTADDDIQISGKS